MRALILAMALLGTVCQAAETNEFLGRYRVSRGSHLFSVGITEHYFADLGAERTGALRTNRYAVRERGPSFMVIELLDGQLWAGCARFLQLARADTESRIVVKGYATQLAAASRGEHCSQDTWEKI